MTPSCKNVDAAVEFETSIPYLQISAAGARFQPTETERLARSRVGNAASLGAAMACSVILLSLLSVCGMSIVFHDEVTYEYLLTGLAVSLVVSCFVIYTWTAIFRDIDRHRWDLIASEERIRQIAHFDALTGLPNRILLRDRLTKALSDAVRNRDPLAILFVDLYRFKSINDSMGHHVGDEVLRRVADRLTTSLRDVDTVARLGGDEFVIVLPRTGAKAAAEVAERIRAAVAQPVVIEGRELITLASIGISMYPDDGIDMDTLIRNADAAMYRAKNDGSSSPRFFHPEVQDRTPRKMALERDIRRAFERKEFQLLYQPQVDVRSGAIVAVAALLRWNHPVHGLLRPEQFMPLAEASGLTLSLGEWLLEEACRQNAEWNDCGILHASVVVPISRLHLGRPGLSTWVLTALQHAGLSCRGLELEFAESTVAEKAPKTIGQLRIFREHGIRIAISEFGIRHCGLTYLSGLPVDKLKIEPCFIKDIARNPQDAGIVRSLIGLAHRLNLKVVAEGVESRPQLSYLRERGCDLYQGSLYAEALPPREFVRMLDFKRSNALRRKVAA